MLMNCSIDTCSLARRKILHLTASLVTLSLPQVWITGLNINTIYSKRDSSLTMDVATDLYMVFNSSGTASSIA